MKLLSAIPTSPNDPTLEPPVSVLRIIVTFVIAYLINLALTTTDQIWLPDFLALTLIYWCVHQPQRVGFVIAFICGLLMDVAHGSVLGQEAFAYVILAYLALLLHRRLPWFSPFAQALHLLPLLLSTQIVVMLVRLWFDGLWPGWPWFLQSVTGALVWPAWSLLMRYRSTPQTD